MADPAAVEPARSDARARGRGLRQRRLPVPWDSRRDRLVSGLWHRPRGGSVDGEPVGLAASRGRRRGTGGEVAGLFRRPPEGCGSRRRRASFCERPSHGGPLRPLFGAPPRNAQAMGGGRDRGARLGRKLAGHAVEKPARADRHAEPGRAPPRSLRMAQRRLTTFQGCRSGSRCSGLRAFPPAMWTCSWR